MSSNTIQLSLLQPEIRVKPQAQSFTIDVRGVSVKVNYTKDYSYHEFLDKFGRVDKVYACQHFEFQTDSAGPISETGYKSLFMNGTTDDLDLNPSNPLEFICELAETLATEYQSLSQLTKRRDTM